MSTYRALLLMVVLPFAVGAYAQQEIRLIDLSALAVPVDIARDVNAKAGMQAAGMEQDRMDAAIELSHPKAWPPGIRTDSARALNAETAMNYEVERFCTYQGDVCRMVIARIPATSNVHMPQDMRVARDFYVVVPEFAVIDAIPQVVVPKPSKGPSYNKMPKAKITKPDGIYATYDLSTDPKALNELERRGLSQAEIDAVVFRSQQRNWPEGIDNFEKRFPKLSKFKKFKAFSAARWDGKVLLIIPAEANKKVHHSLRPYLDIYMVYEAGSVAVAGKSR